MAHAFAPCPPLVPTGVRTTTRTRFRPLCALDPSKPTEPSRDLSATDRMYIAKIKDKLLNTRRAAAAARGDEINAFDPNADDGVFPETPEDLDKMEDVLFDRGPQNLGQVKMFGAWLDEAVAGRKAEDLQTGAADVDDAKSDLSVERNRPQDVSTEAALERADAAFARAMRLFGRGMYTEAARLFSQASSLVGMHSRLGGQYQLWEAQATDAAGQKQAAVRIFQGLGTHGDAEVRKVSRELLFIITAPRLQLDPGSFLEIPDIDEAKSPLTNALLLSNFGPLRTAPVEKPPEPHSLEWYMNRKLPPKVKDNSTAQAIAVAAAIVGTLAFMATSPL